MKLHRLITIIAISLSLAFATYAKEPGQSCTKEGKAACCQSETCCAKDAKCPEGAACCAKSDCCNHGKSAACEKSCCKKSCEQKADKS